MNIIGVKAGDLEGQINLFLKIIIINSYKVSNFQVDMDFVSYWSLDSWLQVDCTVIANEAMWLLLLPQNINKIGIFSVSKEI